MSTSHLSVVIPAYNEEARLGNTLDAVMQFLKSQSYPSEIIVVDDGSRDNTVNLAAQKLQGFPSSVVQYGANRGKGYAVKQGMMKAEGEFILFSDADMSTPIEEASRFLDLLKNQGYDVVIGSRALEDSDVQIRQNIFRQAIGVIFNRLARLLSFRGIHDSQCGFKCFRRDAAKDLFGRQKLDGFSFDAEILYLAQTRGYKIFEAPVIWRNSAQTRVQLLTDPLNMFLDLLRIRWLHRGDQ